MNLSYYFCLGWILSRGLCAMNKGNSEVAFDTQTVLTVTIAASINI